MYLTADNHRKRSIKRYILRILKRHTKLSLEEKAIEREHEGRKEQIDGFFKKMREKAREEEEKVKLAKLEKIHKE
jgi:hypothetical protein